MKHRGCRGYAPMGHLTSFVLIRAYPRHPRFASFVWTTGRWKSGTQSKQDIAVREMIPDTCGLFPGLERFGVCSIVGVRNRGMPTVGLRYQPDGIQI